MNKADIMLELDRLKKEATDNINKEECYIKKFYGCDHCINEFGSCELNSELECLAMAFDELMELIDAIL